MDIRIGVSDSPREIEIETEESVTQTDIESMLLASLQSGEPLVWFTDKRGRRVGIPAQKIGYVELGPVKTERRVGFSAS
ncbi:MAG: DUF3107 domain-containing protein [Acidimicrobiales bacterium]